MPRDKMLEECPNCSSIWAPGSEEWMFQQCGACGYPDPSCEDFMRDDDDFDYGDPEPLGAEEPDYDLEKPKQ